MGKEHPHTSVPIADSHHTKTQVQIPTVLTIKFLDENSKPLKDIEVRRSNSSVRVKTDQNGVVKVQKTTTGPIALRVVPIDQGNPADWSGKPKDSKVDTPKPIAD